ncbi:MAG: hypothetical protein HW412_1459 [Bacteroidetes bacterium]|nr:hypothetical protein [Bacteroidota bacterium]
MQKEFVSWKRLTLNQFHVELQRLLKGSLSLSTLQLYDQAFRMFTRIIGDRHLKRIMPYHVESYKAKRLEEVSATKVNIDLRNLRAAFNRAVQYKMIDSNPFSHLTSVSVPEKEPRFLSPEECRCLPRVVDDEQMKSIIIVTICTTLRLGELVNLKWFDVNFDKGFIHLQNRSDFVLKGKKRRSIPLNKMAGELLLRQRRDSEYVFSNREGQKLSGRHVSRKFKGYARKAGLSEEVHFHCLRHTGASWMVQNNVPISFVKEILGHSSITTTIIYAHATTNHLRGSVITIDRLLTGC